ncbi:hypothetical protein Ddc_03606 [Ditylenchus destructor]|nr:hypothetical protein Ddc_03606 [Ditylenchus destructor]
MSKIDPSCVAYIVPADDAMNPTRITLFIIELALNCAILFVSAGFSVLLFKTKTFNIIPKILLINLFFSAYSIAFTRFFLIAHTMSEGHLLSNVIMKPIQIFHDCCINVNTFHQVALTIECVISTFFPNSYRKYINVKVMPVLTFFWPWFITVVIYALEFGGYLPTVGIFLGFESLNLFSWLIFGVLCVVNRQKYKKIHAGNLQGKYQMIVNIRTIRSINFLSILTALRNFITMTLLLVIMLHYKPNCNYYSYLMASHVYDLVIAVYSLCLPIPLLLTHDELRKHFLKSVLRKNSNQITCGKMSRSRSVAPQIVNAIGENLIVYKGQTEYFRELAASWENHRPNSLPDNWNSIEKRPSQAYYKTYRASCISINTTTQTNISQSIA